MTSLVISGSVVPALGSRRARLRPVMLRRGAHRHSVDHRLSGVDRRHRRLRHAAGRLAVSRAADRTTPWWDRPHYRRHAASKARTARPRSLEKHTAHLRHGKRTMNLTAAELKTPVRNPGAWFNLIVAVCLLNGGNLLLDYIAKNSGMAVHLFYRRLSFLLLLVSARPFLSTYGHWRACRWRWLIRSWSDCR